MARFSLIVLAFAVVLAALAVSAGAVGEGWGEASIPWKSYDEGLAEAKASGRPAFVLIHKTWCGACKRLKKSFEEEHAKLAKYADDVVFINCEDDAEPTSADFRPDGGYVPRGFFVSSEGEVLPDYNEGGNAKYKFFYPNLGSITRALDRVKASGAGRAAGGASSEPAASDDGDNAHSEL